MADRSTHAGVTAADAEARYRALCFAVREPFPMTSADGCISGLNGADRSLFGHLARIAGRPIREVLPLVVLAEGGAEQPTWEGPLVDATGHTPVVEVSRTRLDDAHLPIIDVDIVHDVSRYVEPNGCADSPCSGSPTSRGTPWRCRTTAWPSWRPSMAASA